MDGVFYNTHTLKGIDPVLFDTLNETLPVPIDRESFERGEVAIINAAASDLSGYFDGVSTLEIKREADTEYMPLTVGGIVCLPATQSETAFQYSDMEILVSNSFLEQCIDQPQLLSFGLNVDSEYEEPLYHSLKDFAANHGVSMVSRYEGRQPMQDAKAIMLVLGGGISFILGFIGVFNFINVMSVGVMSRRHELAVLESIGMSKKQLRSMLRYEGLDYAAITLLFTATLGNLVGYGLFRIFQTIVDYAVYHYPIIPVLTVYAIVLVICLITPEITYRGISKQPLVERLRQVGICDTIIRLVR